MEKSLLIGAVINNSNHDNEVNDLMIIDKVIVAHGSASSTKYLAVDKSGDVYQVDWDEIEKIVSFPDKSPSPSGFINSSTSKK